MKNQRIKRKIIYGGSVIETSVTTYHVTWIRFDFLEWGEDFRKIRSRISNKFKEEKYCFVCLKDWEEGESMALAHFRYIGNRTICKNCAETIESKRVGII